MATRPLRRNLLLGQIALRMQEILEEELREAISIQESLHQDGIAVLLGKVSSDKGHVSASSLEHLLAAQRAGRETPRDHYFGNIAVSNQFLDRATLKRTLLLQRRFGQRKRRPAPHLGRILVARGALDDQQVRAILAAQARLRTAEPILPRSGRFRPLSWYVATETGEQGPLADRELSELLRSGTVGAGDLVWREGWEDWDLAGSLPDYAQRLAAGEDGP